MAESTKYQPINGGTLVFSELSLFSLNKTRKSMVFTYGLVLVFVGFTAFLAFNPSPNSSAPWFSNIFSISSSSSSISNSSSSVAFNHDDGTDGSHFSSIINYFFPNSSQSQQRLEKPNLKQNFTSVDDQTNITRSDKNLSSAQNGSSGDVLKQNQTKIETSKTPVFVNGKNESNGGVGLKQNQTVTQTLKAPPVTVNQKGDLPKNNLTSQEKKKSGVDEKVVAEKGFVPKNNSTSQEKKKSRVDEKVVAEKGLVSNYTASMVKKKQENGTQSDVPVKQGNKNGDMIDSLMNCDLFDGNWVRDESYPLYKPGSCSLIDEQFNCVSNGRPDHVYQQLKWKPKGCNLPRLNAHNMLDMLRGKRLVFVGDSLNRNMWESLVCILKTAVKDQSKVYEASGRHHFRTEASYSFIFKDYGCTIEFFVSPFLVQEWDLKEQNGSTKETLRLDLIGRSADKYKDADIIIFNTGHWWTHDKTSKGKDYYQEGSHVYGELNVIEAFRKALTTWARWVDARVNPNKSFVFFRGYSASHFSGGQWNSGGQCDSEREPIKNETYLRPYPPKMNVLEKVLKGMKTHVTYLNITRITDYRKDGHPSVYRKKNLSEKERKSPLRFQDCSHWCLPGVPDAWNELLYAELLVRQKQ